MPTYTGNQGEQLDKVPDDEVIVHSHTAGLSRECLVTLPHDFVDDDGPYACDICSLTVDTVEELEEGYRYYYSVTDSEFECGECAYTHEDESQMKRHFTMEHTEESND